MDHLSLYLGEILTSYQVYADGHAIGGCGQVPPHAVPRFCKPMVLALPANNSSSPREVTIAIRVWQWSAWAAYGGGPQGASYVGTTSQIQSRQQVEHAAAVALEVQYYVLLLLASLGALVSFALYVFRRRDREYFWFGCMLLEAGNYALSIYRDLHATEVFLYYRWANVIENLGLWATLAFYYVLLRGRRTWLFYAACTGIALALLLRVGNTLPGLNLLMHFNLPWLYALSITVTLPLIAWILTLLLRRAREGILDARLLLAPVILLYGEYIASYLAVATFLLGWQHRFTGLGFPLFSSPFPVDFHVLAELFFLIAMLAILVNRFARTRREEERYAGEFEAARGIQSLLVPATTPSTPGFAVESVYLPASEVGGDFFHISPGEDGSLLIVVGDVSGKGLKAAMTVSMIVGALRNETSRQPAQVLAHLNRVLHGQVSGFVTCSAALIASDGAMTIANAGHLAPYRNGEELAVDSGLPLGILAEGSYAETNYPLALGDRLTFVSDGVVEATNEKRELFGFERTQAISHQSAHAIAEAAKNFGQEDDISVLAVTRLAATT
jgi:hypothetical protein